MKIENKRDFLAGLMLTGFGVAALLLSSQYRMGTASRMGPGYFPMGIGGLLCVVGFVISGRAFKWQEAGWPKLAWRPLAAITGAVVVFALLLNSAGLSLALCVLVGVSRLGRPEYTWRETVILCLVVCVLCLALFHFGLRLRLPLWPRFW
jgi:hypothetical protein